MSVWVYTKVDLDRNYLINHRSVGKFYIVMSQCLRKTSALICFLLMGQICHGDGDWADSRIFLICMFPLFPLHQHSWSWGYRGSSCRNGKLISYVMGSFNILCLHHIRRQNHVVVKSSEEWTCPFAGNVLNLILK